MHHADSHWSREARALGPADGGNAEIGAQAAIRCRPIDNRTTHGGTETAVRKILEFNALCTPDLLDRVYGRAPRLGAALLQLVNGPLRQADALTQFALTPAEHRARHAQLGGKGAPLEANKLDQVAAAMGGNVNCHCGTLRSLMGEPPAVSRRGFCWSDRHAAITDRSRDARGSGPSSCRYPRSEEHTSE